MSNSAFYQDLVIKNPKLIASMTPRATPFMRHVPFPKQAAFLLLDCEEALYGGAGGGGKGDCLLLAALQYVDVPGYSAIIFRRTFPELSLPGSMIPRSHDWLGGTGARWSEKNKRWTFPNSGATLTFGHMENEKDCEKYLSSEFHFAGFDELTTFTKYQWDYISSRTRRLKGSEIPIRKRGASNPGGVGHSWVKQHFLVEGASKGRVFLPAKLSDNPYIDQEAYIKSLSHLDPVSRARILNGDWDARFEGSLFRREWCEIVKPEHVPSGILTVRAWDRAGTKKTAHNKPDWTVGVKMGRTENGIIYLKHIVRFQGTPLENRTAIRNTAVSDRGETYEIVLPEDPGSAGKDTIDTYRREVLPEFKIYSERQTGSKLERGGAFASQCQAGNVKLVEGPWLSDYFDEMENYDGSDNKVDDQWDSSASGYNRLVTLSGTTSSAVITTGTQRRGMRAPSGRIVCDPSYERHLQVQRQLAELDEKK